MAVTKETEAGSDLDSCLDSDLAKTTREPWGQASCKPAQDDQLRRERRLMKNREAARECRRKKKEYVKCLENHLAMLENQNKTLIEELKALKYIYSHKGQ
ncbi:cyclic AMP-dependent transcription factor ATF-1-like [Takifugu flavidus]|uniref:Cyclic AMP-dependent transcription factor ATF-1 n=1 Tax=Takifugu flavidus TaxID=433684 RepID=A0A5C6NW55_9TELE|nr:cyclic AMP-dependent transcription factor ATF-1-like [Takifugu flavidus]TWW71256.1 Cyclic AMP-dependent transcription factor ATF-1 [Takifugu flavidus]